MWAPDLRALVALLNLARFLISLLTVCLAAVLQGASLRSVYRDSCR